MALHDPAARNDEAGRVEMQRTERVGGLLDQRRRVDTVSTSDIAEVFDWMHIPNVRHEKRSTSRRTAIIRRVADTDTQTSGSATDGTGIQLPADLVLTPLHKGAPGTGRPLMEWLTTFHLASVVLDPYTNESSWILRTATRVLDEFRDCDVRINLIVTADAADAAEFLGPLVDQFLVFCDPDRAAVKAMRLTELPAFVLTRVDGLIEAKAEGWNPHEWEAVCDDIAKLTKWTSIELPMAGDPVPFRGSPALG